MQEVGFEEALNTAKKCVAKKTGDHQPRLLLYQLGGDHVFHFQTTAGDHHIIIDRNGKVGHCYVEEQAEQAERPPRISHWVAVEHALEHIGKGKVSRVKAWSDGYEVEVEHDGRICRVYVDGEGKAHSQKRSLLSTVMAEDMG